MKELAASEPVSGTPRRAGYLKCPICRAIDWQIDGVRIVGAQLDGEIHGFQIATPNGTQWTCSQCLYAVVAESHLAASLAAARVFLTP
jgi:predicted nucleic-acid-binding Zn-ribbon protein